MADGIEEVGPITGVQYFEPMRCAESEAYQAAKRRIQKIGSGNGIDVYLVGVLHDDLTEEDIQQNSITTTTDLDGLSSERESALGTQALLRGTRVLRWMKRKLSDSGGDDIAQ